MGSRWRLEVSYKSVDGEANNRLDLSKADAMKTWRMIERAPPGTVKTATLYETPLDRWGKPKRERVYAQIVNATPFDDVIPF